MNLGTKRMLLVSFVEAFWKSFIFKAVRVVIAYEYNERVSVMGGRNWTGIKGFQMVKTIIFIALKLQKRADVTQKHLSNTRTIAAIREIEIKMEAIEVREIPSTCTFYSVAHIFNTARETDTEAFCLVWRVFFSTCIEHMSLIFVQTDMGWYNFSTFCNFDLIFSIFRNFPLHSVST